MQLELAKLKNTGLIKSIGKAKATLWSLIDRSRNNHESYKQSMVQKLC
jgi:hypothetical protein